jgi:hypothetical protein
LLPVGAMTAVVRRAENVGAHVDFADVDEPSRPQRKVTKSLPIGTQRYLIVHSGGHVTEMRRRHILHQGLEVEDIQRLLGVFDQFTKIARRPVCGVQWP